MRCNQKKEVTGTMKKMKPIKNVQKPAKYREIAQIKVKETKHTEMVSEIDGIKGN